MSYRIPAFVLCLAAGAVITAPNARQTVITAKRASFDYKESIAEFVGDVVVVDPEVTMHSDKLTVFFDGSNDVKSVVALGNVRLRYQGKAATCRKAVYIANDGYIAMTGDATIKDGRDTIVGKVIQIWIHDEKMTVEPGRLVIYPDEGSKKSPLLKNPRAGGRGR
ncbi:LptA/OstA family protein [Verrucomicrobiota bacterium]